MILTDALAIIAVHNHPHYKSERTQHLLQEAQQVVVKHVQEFERKAYQNKPNT